MGSPTVALSLTWTCPDEELYNALSNPTLPISRAPFDLLVNGRLVPENTKKTTIPARRMRIKRPRMTPTMAPDDKPPGRIRRIKENNVLF